jgi:hypothetical protein
MLDAGRRVKMPDVALSGLFCRTFFFVLNYIRALDRI